MYRTLIREKFPLDENLGLFVFPKLPAVKLGKLLRKDTRISSPNDVLALHIYDSMFSSGSIIFTTDTCFYPKGKFLLEDVRSAKADGDDCIVTTNQQGGLATHTLSTKSKEVAQILTRFLDAVKYFDPEEQQAPLPSYEEQGFDTSQVKWLEIRDEVMKTIDLLFEKYNDGKLSLLEYEQKKEELLSRL
ncbi:MAG: hypothetical protein AAF388_12165 [Bacteroidota bacterium]